MTAPATASRFVDLSHTVTDGMVTYPGLPTPRLGTVLSRAESRGRYAPGVEFHIGSIELCTNTGTYLDTPCHRYADGWDLDGLPLDRCADLAVVVIDVPPGAVPPGGATRPPEQAHGFGAGDIAAAERAGADLRGAAVLLRTGWSARWGTDGYVEAGHPYLSADGTEALVRAGAALVGIDALNIDDTRGTDRPAHSGLLAAGIPIVEHLTGLDRLPVTGARFTAVPVRIAGLGTFPVRAFATLPSPPVVCEVVIDGHDVRRLAEFWAAVTGGRARVRSDDWATVTTAEPAPTVIAFQRVPEAKTTKNRVHLDITSGDITADTARAVGLGATVVGSLVEDDVGPFQVLLDPEGNEWCLVG